VFVEANHRKYRDRGRIDAPRWRIVAHFCAIMRHRAAKMAVVRTGSGSRAEGSARTPVERGHGLREVIAGLPLGIVDDQRLNPTRQRAEGARISPWAGASFAWRFGRNRSLPDHPLGLTVAGPLAGGRRAGPLP